LNENSLKYAVLKFTLSHISLFLADQHYFEDILKENNVIIFPDWTELHSRNVIYLC